MHITIIGTEPGSRLLAQTLVREGHKMEFWIQRDGGRLEEYREFPTERFDDVRNFLEVDLKTDAVVFCDRSPGALALAGHFSHLNIPVHFVVYDPGLGEMLEREKDRFGIDYVYDYGKYLAERVHRFFYAEEGMQTEVFENFGFALIKWDIGDHPGFVGRRVRDIGPFEDLVLVVIRRDGRVIIPDGNTVLEANDVLRMIGNMEAIRRFRRRHVRVLPFDEEGRGKFLIYGDSRGAACIESYLSDLHVDTVTIGNIKRRGNVTIPKNKPITNILDNVDVESFDGFIAASSSDANNFLAATAARNANMKHVALCLRDERFMRIVDVSHNGGIFSGELLVSQKIKHNLSGHPDISLHLFPGNLDIYEIALKEDAFACGKTIEELGLSEGFLIGGIDRGGESILAKGKTVLKAGDRLLLFLLPESAGDLNLFVRRKPKRYLTELFSL